MIWRSANLDEHGCLDLHDISKQMLGGTNQAQRIRRFHLDPDHDMVSRGTKPKLVIGTTVLLPNGRLLANKFGSRNSHHQLLWKSSSGRRGQSHMHRERPWICNSPTVVKANKRHIASKKSINSST